MRRLALALALTLVPGLLGAESGPLMAAFTTCAGLTPQMHPADTTTWFEASRHPQVVLFAHMLFPLRPELDFTQPSAPTPQPGPWHPPLIYRPAALTTSAQTLVALGDDYYAEAEWLDPDARVIAHFGLTMPARVSTDYVLVGGRQYIPHTFSMAIGTKDLRAAAGQTALPSKAGQYHVRMYVDGKMEGLAFFRMLSAGQPSLTPLPTPVTPTGAEGAQVDPLGAIGQMLNMTRTPKK